MYIIGSIAIISLAEVFGALLFRSWQLRRGHIDAEVHSDGPLGVIHHTTRIQRHTALYVAVHGRKLIPIARKIFLTVQTFIAERTGMGKLKEMVDGRMPAQNGKTSAPSLYLKDITEHKNSVKRDVKNF